MSILEPTGRKQITEEQLRADLDNVRAALFAGCGMKPTKVVIGDKARAELENAEGSSPTARELLRMAQEGETT